MSTKLERLRAEEQRLLETINRTFHLRLKLDSKRRLEVVRKEIADEEFIESFRFSLFLELK